MYPARSNYFFFPEEKTCSLEGVEVYSVSSDQLICVDKGCRYKVDSIAYEVQATVKKIASFFHKHFGLCGLDGNGSLAPIYIDWNEDNAKWECGVGPSLDCPGCQETCEWTFNNKYALSPAVVAHEYMHAVTRSHSRLNWRVNDCRRNEGGALDESISDVFACAFMHSLGKNNWTIKGVDRDLSKHAHLDDFEEASVCDSESDYGHVHSNCAIPSHAFYVTVTQFKDDRLLEVAKIWFKALQEIKRSNETFKSFAAKTIEAATETQDAYLILAVKRAWDHVGVVKLQKEVSIDSIESALSRFYIGDDSYLEEEYR